MIRTVTVYTGESVYAKAAQEHAIEMAKQFDAQLKIVRIWHEQNEQREADAPEPSAALAKRNQEAIARMAEQAEVRSVQVLQGNGMTRGFLKAARETDLLVLGLPTQAEKDKDDAASILVRKERPVLRKADCALLVVNRSPTPIRKVLARYEGGRASQDMLRMTAAIAQRYRAHVGLLTLDNDVAKAVELATVGEKYLKDFDLPAVQTLRLSGSTASKVQILHAAESFGADLIAMGEEGHNWLECLLGENLAERTALLTSIPLLIVR